LGSEFIQKPLLNSRTSQEFPATRKKEMKKLLPLGNKRRRASHSRDRRGKRALRFQKKGGTGTKSKGAQVPIKV